MPRHVPRRADFPAIILDLSIPAVNPSHHGSDEQMSEREEQQILRGRSSEEICQ